MILSLLLAAAFAAAPEEPMSQVDSWIAYAVPEDWSVARDEKQVAVSRGLQRIDIRLEGGKDAEYPTREDYLRRLRRGPFRRSAVSVSGTKTWLYVTRVPIPLEPGQHNAPSPPMKAAARYTVLLPAGRASFLILEGQEESGDSDRALKDFRAFLESVRFKKSSRR